MANRKRRTKEHVIADMSFHYLAYFVVKNGFTIEGIRSDYGYDAHVVTFDRNGEVENGLIFIQLKATLNIVYGRQGKMVLFRVSKKDVQLWEDEPFPVYLVIFDAVMECAYWVHFQNYLQINGMNASSIAGKTVTVYIDSSQKLNLTAVSQWHADKADVLAKIGSIQHV